MVNHDDPSHGHANLKAQQPPPNKTIICYFEESNSSSLNGFDNLMRGLKFQPVNLTNAFFFLLLEPS